MSLTVDDFPTATRWIAFVVVAVEVNDSRTKTRKFERVLYRKRSEIQIVSVKIIIIINK